MSNINTNPPTVSMPNEEQHQMAYQAYLLRPVGTRMNYEQFKAESIYLLSHEHCGDCTAFPGECYRCVTEEIYGIPSTVTWDSTEFWDVEL